MSEYISDHVKISKYRFKLLEVINKNETIHSLSVFPYLKKLNSFTKYIVLFKKEKRNDSQNNFKIE